MPEIKTTRLLLGLILLAAILRLFTLNDYPLTDKTGSRYAEIGREMYVSGNWVTPQIDQGTPFWAKPPLSMWLTATSYSVFGVNEFSARLPSYLLGGAVLWLMFLLTQHLYGRFAAVVMCAVLVSSFQFLLMQGGVMTDPALGFSITLMTVSFIMALDTGSRRWGYLLFAGAGLGLLAKGPIALILTGLPVFIWLFWKSEWKNFGHKLPWAGGLALMLAIALPWYILAEMRTPGFYQYFFIGEHFHRFTDPNWAGDLYGTPHSKVKGTIWFYWLTATLPWSLLFIGFVIGRLSGRNQNRLLFNQQDKWVGLVLLWALSPMIFFTTAGSLTWAYVYPAVPAFALVVTFVLLQRNETDNSLQLKPYWLTLGLVFLVPLATNIVLMNSYNLFSARATQIPLLEQFKARAEAGAKLAYACERPISADFYGHDLTLAMQHASEAQWQALFSQPGKNFAVIDECCIEDLPAFLRPRMKEVGRLREYILLMDQGEAAAH